jgi:hypothetical protein
VTAVVVPIVAVVSDGSVSDCAIPAAIVIGIVFLLLVVAQCRCHDYCWPSFGSGLMAAVLTRQTLIATSWLATTTMSLLFPLLTLVRLWNEVAKVAYVRFG